MKKLADVLSKKRRIDYWEDWVNKHLHKPRELALMINKKEELADYDTLTKVLNRRGLLNYLSIVTQLMARAGQKMALLFVDVDKLKKINDEKGHKAGDKVILTVAECLKKSVRSSDFVGRWGGDEFVVVLTGVKDKEDVVKIFNRVNPCLAAHTTVTMGAALWNKNKDVSEQIEAADAAMYKAKKSKTTKLIFVEEEGW